MQAKATGRRGDRYVPVAFAILIAGLAAPTVATAQVDRGAQGAPTPPEGSSDGWWVAGEVHSAFLSDIAVASADDFAFGLGVRGGQRPPGYTFGWVLVLDNTWWVQPTLDAADEDDVFTGTMQGMLALGVGIEDLYFDRHMRLAFAIGPTLLLRDTALDDAGTMGYFADLRPAGIRFDAFGLSWVLDPLSLMIALPDTSGIPLVLIHFNTVLAVELDPAELW